MQCCIVELNTNWLCVMETDLYFAIETYNITERDDANKKTDSTDRTNVYGIVFTIWGAHMKTLNLFDSSATNALKNIIMVAGNQTITEISRVSRQRFSNNECCIEISAVPVFQSTNSKYFDDDKSFAKVNPTYDTGTVLNHEIVQLFLKDVVSNGYIFNGIERLDSSNRENVLRLKVALTQDTRTSIAGPSSSQPGSLDDDDDSNNDSSGPKYARTKNPKQSTSNLKNDLNKKSKGPKNKKMSKDKKAANEADAETSNEKDRAVTTDEIFAAASEAAMETDQDDNNSNSKVTNLVGNGDESDARKVESDGEYEYYDIEYAEDDEEDGTVNNGGDGTVIEEEIDGAASGADMETDQDDNDADFNIDELFGSDDSDGNDGNDDSDEEDISVFGV